MNRELVLPGGAGIYPLVGDVTSTAGSPSVKVTGLQGTPLELTTLLSGQELQYNANINQWQPTLNAVIQVNGISVSDDPTITVNVNRPIKINGV